MQAHSPWKRRITRRLQPTSWTSAAAAATTAAVAPPAAAASQPLPRASACNRSHTQRLRTMRVTNWFQKRTSMHSSST